MGLLDIIYDELEKGFHGPQFTEFPLKWLIRELDGSGMDEETKIEYGDTRYKIRYGNQKLTVKAVCEAWHTKWVEYDDDDIGYYIDGYYEKTSPCHEKYKYCLSDNFEENDNADVLLRQDVCQPLNWAICMNAKNLKDEIQKLPNLFFNQYNYEWFYRWIKNLYEGDFRKYLNKGYSNEKIQIKLKEKYGSTKKALDEKRQLGILINEKYQKYLMAKDQKMKDEIIKQKIEKGNNHKKEKETQDFIEDSFDRM